MVVRGPKQCPGRMFEPVWVAGAADADAPSFFAAV
jgi:hypothetical protein